jgi:hypothetical protein
MEQEFSLKKGWKIFSYIASSLFFIGSILAFYFAFAERKPELVFIYIPILLFSVYFLMATIKCKIVISDYKIMDVGVFTTKQLFIEEIKGYGDDGQNITVFSRIKGKKKILIGGYKKLEGCNELLFWLNHNLKDITQDERMAEALEINNNPDFGITYEQRENRFKVAKRISRGYNILSVGFIVGAYFSWNAHHLFTLLMLLYPFFGVLILFLNKGIIKIETRPNSNYPNISMGLIFSSFFMLIRSIVGYQINDYHNFWGPCLLVGVVLFALLNKTNVRPSGAIDKGQILAIILITSAYAYGGPVIVNCDFDASVNAVVPVTILDQHKLSGKITTYILTVGPWGKHTQSNDVDVSRSLYQEVSPGDRVNVNIKRGSLRIPWFYISR